uniref:hypothetical protein n=1 Tax=uncultured Acinetobacter sp. TaxID=165433 RepID=UPI00261FF318|nr:hypothetical protein [uncultured Acinetobacter sp.]
MTLTQSTELYATVLRQLLPIGGYDRSPKTLLAKDIQAHAKAFAKADMDAKRLLQAISGVPTELLGEYETDYGLPLPCTVNTALSTAERLEILSWVINQTNVFNVDYLYGVFALFGITINELVTYTPMQCTASCTDPVNTEQLRYKVTLKLQSPVTADVQCIIDNYLPAFLRIDVEIE